MAVEPTSGNRRYHSSKGLRLGVRSVVFIFAAEKAELMVHLWIFSLLNLCFNMVWFYLIFLGAASSFI